MSEPFIGEIRIFAGQAIPGGWLRCDGHPFSISVYQPLFSVIGTLYGGDGVKMFNVPNLNDHAALNAGLAKSGNTYMLGTSYGEASVTLTDATMPAHTHQLSKKNTDAGNAGKVSMPSKTCDLGGLSAANGSVGYQSGNNAQSPNTNLDPRTITMTGASRPHENRQPFLAMYFAIAYLGIFPT